MEDKKPGQKVFSWTLWKYDIDLSGLKEGENTPSPMVRAISNDGKVQDGEWKDQFNARGILNNTPHTININLHVRK